MPFPASKRAISKRILHATAAALGSLCLCAGAAQAGNVVLGDSNSAPFSDAWSPWPVLLFGDDYVDMARGGQSTYGALNGCAGTDCWWLRGTSPDDVWWIMLGTNDVAVNPDTTAADYAQNMQSIIDLIPSQDIRILSSPLVQLSPLHPRNTHLRGQALIDAVICDSDPRVSCVANLAELVSGSELYVDSVHLNGEGHRLVAQFLAVPEPGTAVLVGAGLAAVARRARRRP